MGDIERESELDPEIDFSQLIKFAGRSSSEVSRQVTVKQYRTFNREFDFDEVQQASQKCRLTPTDDFGVINIRTSQGAKPKGRIDDDQLDMGTRWVRALYGIIGDTNFRVLGRGSNNIYEYMISNVLKETFLVEYYEGANNHLRFLTYGGTRYSKRIKAKHKLGFGPDFFATADDFSHELMRHIFGRDEFLHNLKSVSYMPSGQDGFGTISEVTAKTKYKKMIDPDAERVKEILGNDKILISEFETRFSMRSPEVKGTLNIRFIISAKGQIKFHLPKLEFRRPLDDIKREDVIYDVVRKAYANITNSAYKRDFYAPENQLILDFLRDD